jgi:hypothetical protein
LLEREGTTMNDELLRRFRELNPVPDPDRFVDLGAPDWPADPALRAVLEQVSTKNHRPRIARLGPERDPATNDRPMPTLTPPRNGSARPEPRSRRGWLLNAAAVAAVVLAVGLIATFGPLDDDAIAPAAPEPAAPEPEPDVEIDGVTNGPDAPESVTFDTQLGSWTWTWIPEGEEAARRWQEASDNWDATGAYVDVDPFPASIQEVSRVTPASWGNVRRWLDWNRVPWARLDTTTIAAFFSGSRTGSTTDPAATPEDWHLVVDTGQGYEPHEVPWYGLPVMSVDLAVGADDFVAVALVGELDTNDGNPSDEPPLMHSWRSADGAQWEELSPPLAVGDVRQLRLVAGHERLLLRLEGPEPSMLSSPDGVDWQQVGPDPITDWYESAHTSTSYGWAMARAGPEVPCEVWVSADTISWEQVPFDQAVEKRPVGGAHDCRLVGDEVYVRLAKGEDYSTAMGLWIGHLDD